VHTTWIAASACLMIDLMETANRGLKALLDWPVTDWDDSQIAWALDCLNRGGIKRNHVLVIKLLARLEARQGTDGQWASEDGSEHDVSATIEALKVLRHYKRFTEIPLVGMHESAQ